MFPIIEDNALSLDERVKGLETQNNKTRERLSKIEGILQASGQQKATHPLLITFLSIIGTAVLGFWGWIAVQVYVQGQKIERLYGIVAPQVVENAAMRPEDPRSAQQVAQAFSTAAKQGVKIDPTVVQEAGTKFIDASDKSQTAWATAMILVNYRSSFNVLSRTVTTTAIPPGEHWTRWNFDPPVPGKPEPSVSHVAIPTTPGQGARYETIGENLNPKFESAEYLLNGGALDIDNKDIRNVVFQNVEIHYSGKPVIIQGALFINCIFVFDNTPSTRQLGRTLLAESTIDFQTAG
jgi:hypothetical protein